MPRAARPPRTRRHGDEPDLALRDPMHRHAPDPVPIKPILDVPKPDWNNVAAIPLPPPVPVRDRHDGWTAARQRIFLTLLAETGSVSLACSHAGVSSRSAYRLRARPDATAFAEAWDQR